MFHLLCGYQPQTEWGTVERSQAADSRLPTQGTQTKAQLLPSGEPEHLPPEDPDCWWMTSYINSISGAGLSTGQDQGTMPGTHAHDVSMQEAQAQM